MPTIKDYESELLTNKKKIADETYKQNLNNANLSFQSTVENADILNQKIMKYLPMINKKQGIEKQGIGQSSYIKATANYANAIGNANSTLSAQKENIYNNYQNSLNGIDEDQASLLSSRQTANDMNFATELEDVSNDGRLTLDEKNKSILSLYDEYLNSSGSLSESSLKLKDKYLSTIESQRAFTKSTDLDDSIKVSDKDVSDSKQGDISINVNGKEKHVKTGSVITQTSLIANLNQSNSSSGDIVSYGNNLYFKTAEGNWKKIESRKNTSGYNELAKLFNVSEK